jgi:hypothetical protein
MNEQPYTIVDTRTGRTVCHITKGNEPMTFSPEFKKAVGLMARTNLGEIKQKIADEVCQKTDNQLLAKLASQ